jgi:internalin A
MPEKNQARAKTVEDTRTPEETAEERIAEWKRDPEHAQKGWFRFALRALGAATRMLSLSNLGLKKVPESLREVRTLEVLWLDGNKIQELPPWIGELSALKVITLSKNHLRTLPPAIGSLRELRYFSLEENRIEQLPETLRTLPLKLLNLRSNPALGLPESILGRPPEEILRYYFESRYEKGSPLLELKLLLVGRGGAGKTTLVKRLAGEVPDAYEPETHSIAIRELTLACPRGQVRTRAWDFGG